MSTRPHSELLLISTRRGLGIEKVYREIAFAPARALGWYGLLPTGEITWLGLSLDHAKAALLTMPVPKKNGKHHKTAGTASQPQTTAMPATPITTRRRAKR